MATEKKSDDRAAVAAPAAPPETPPPFSGPRNTDPPEGGYQPGYPKVFYSTYDRLPPIVVKTPDEEAAIDTSTWMTVPPQPPAKK